MFYGRMGALPMLVSPFWALEDLKWQEMSYHLMGTLGAQGLSPCSSIGTLGRSQLQGCPVCKHGVECCGWALK